jgi:hypothetical protein
MTSVSASTSVVLVDTASGLGPYIVYFPYLSTIGRIITIRDNDGYASTGNSVILSTVSGVSFDNNISSLLINQPYGFITVSSQPNGFYSVLNTFAFPTGSESAYVYNLNTNNLGLRDSSTNIIENVKISTGLLYYGSKTVGDVGQETLDSNIAYIQGKINSSYIVRRYVAIGSSGTPNTSLGSIQYSDTSVTWNDANGGTEGFTNNGIDLTVSPYGLFVACGNNYTPNSPNNLGYLQWSIDGIFWNNSTSPSLSLNTLRNKVNYANGLWHAVGLGSDSNSILFSYDGKSWTPSLNNVSNVFDIYGFNSITYGKGHWVACGSNSFHSAYSLIHSTDGSNWNPNMTLNTSLNPFYDVVYTGYTFVALAGNSGVGNIVISVSGSNDSIIIPENFSNESGFLATNTSILLAVTASFHKYSLDYGYTWKNMPDFPSGKPGRPYYDGSIWWVGVNNGSASNLYYSTSGSNLWTTSNLTGNFPSGYPQSIVSLNLSSNLNIQLISTVGGLQESFRTSTLQVDNISTGSFIINNYNNNLNINSFDSSVFVSMNILSTNIINTNTIYINTLEISKFDVSTINLSTLYASDTIESSLFIGNYISTSGLVFDTLYMSSMFVSNLSTYSLNVSSINSDVLQVDTISSMMIYSDILSTNTAVISTINLIDNTTGNLAELNANNSNLYFQGQKLLTTVGTNPLYFTYQLQDITSGLPGNIGFFSVDNADLKLISVINFSVTDYNNIFVSGLFNRIGIYSILYIINPNTQQTFIYTITSITPSINLSYYTFNLLPLIGTSEIINVNQLLSFYISNIGIKPPPSSPTDTVIVNASISSGGTSFDFNDAFNVLPLNIGTTYRGTAQGFIIILNSDNYNITNIPATVGCITYFDGTNYNQVNVKYGSINASVGGAITIDSGVNNLVLSGLKNSNFTGVTNDSNNFALYITIKFLN